MKRWFRWVLFELAFERHTLLLLRLAEARVRLRRARAAGDRPEAIEALMATYDANRALARSRRRLWHLEPARGGEVAS